MILSLEGEPTSFLIVRLTPVAFLRSRSLPEAAPEILFTEAKEAFVSLMNEEVGVMLWSAPVVVESTC
jgi:hypothetical protein